MPQLIEVPGHGVVEFPDGMDDAAIAKAIKKNLLVPKKPAGVNTNDPARKIALGSRAVGMGAASIPLMFGDAANSAINLGISGVNALGGNIPKLPLASQAANNLLTRAGAPEPITPMERYVSAGSQGAAGAMSFPGATAMTGVSGLTAGLGGEAGADFTGGSWWGRLLGSLGGGLAPNISGIVKGLPARRLQSATEGMDDRAWADAIAKQDQANAAGIRVTGPEATGNKDLLAKQLLVEQHPRSGPLMQAFNKDRTGQVDKAVRGVLSQVGDAADDPRLLGANMQQEARDAIERGRQYAANVSKPAYIAADEVGVPPKMSFRGQQHRASMRPLAGPDTAVPDAIKKDTLIQYAINAVKNDPALKIPPGAGDDSHMVLDLAQKWLKGQAEAIRGGDMTKQLSERFKASNYDQSRAQILSYLDEANANYTVARNLYERASASQVTPRQQGLVGDISKSSNAQDQFNAFKSPTESRAPTVALAAKDLKVRDPKQFQTFVRTGLENEFNSAMKNLQGTGQEFAGARFARQMRDTPQSAENIKALLLELPDGQSKVQAFNKLIDVLETTGNRLPVGSRTAFNSRQLQDMTSESLLQLATKNPTGFIGQKWQNVQEAMTAKKFAEIFTDPNSVRLMRQLIMTNPDTAKARSLVGSLFGYAVSDHDK
jgi:hypothetical protein